VLAEFLLKQDTCIGVKRSWTYVWLFNTCALSPENECLCQHLPINEMKTSSWKAEIKLFYVSCALMLRCIILNAEAMIY